MIFGVQDLNQTLPGEPNFRFYLLNVTNTLCEAQSKLRWFPHK